MGLSATQTRFLMVTARKSNVEYQGQQINQARTALANQSSQLYTEMMSLNAPTAPSPYKYVLDPATNPNIDWQKETPYPLSGDAADNFEIYYAGHEPQFQDFNIPEYVEQFDDTAKSIGYLLKNVDDAGQVHLGTPIIGEDGKVTYDKTLKQATDISEAFCVLKEGKNSAGEAKKYYEVNIPEGAGFTYDITEAKFGLEIDGKFETTVDKVANLPIWAQAYNNARGLYNIYSEPNKASIYAKGADLSGLDNNIVTDDPLAVAYSQSGSKSIDDAQYQAAYVQYERDLKQYEEACEQINQKTEQIHQADKKLELQLKQLDTERSAIDTEYEALQKVLKKNIETTYKTFNA